MGGSFRLNSSRSGEEDYSECQTDDLGIMDSEAAADQIQAMRTQEDNISYRCVDYLAEAIYDEMDDGDDGENRGPVDENCRRKMTIWCCQVVDFCKFGSRETVFMASAYLDRFLSSADNMAQKTLSNRKLYQLFSMTSLYLAIKIQETVEVDLSIMVRLGRGDYATEDFVQAEKDLVRVLGWRLNGPTPTEFVRRLVSLLPPRSPTTSSPTGRGTSTSKRRSRPSSQLHESRQDSNTEFSSTAVASDEYMLMDFARFQTEISVTDYTFVTTKPSVVATASVLNAIDTIKNLRLTTHQKLDFIDAIKQATNLDLQSSNVLAVREQLRIRFNKSRGHSTICPSEESSNAYTYMHSSSSCSSQSQKSASFYNAETTTVCESVSSTFDSNDDNSPICVRIVQH